MGPIHLAVLTLPGHPDKNLHGGPPPQLQHPGKREAHQDDPEWDCHKQAVFIGSWQ